MFEAFEKQELLAQRYALSKFLVRESGTLRSDLFTLALVNFIKRTAPSNYQDWDSVATHNPNDPQQLEKLLANALEIVFNVATEEVAYGKVYSTGQLAKLFGVSITTIHNWIKEGRFSGVEPTAKHKQTKFPESARWKSPSGDWITIREIAEQFAPEEKKEVPYKQEQIELTNAITFYEKKYGCTLEQFQNQFDLENASYEMRRDVREWEYLLRRVNGREECEEV